MNKQIWNFLLFSINKPSWRRKMAIATDEFWSNELRFQYNWWKQSFSISKSIYWTPDGSEEIVTKLYNLLELRSLNDIELHVKKFEKEVLEKNKRTVDKILPVLIISKVKYLQK